MWFNSPFTGHSLKPRSLVLSFDDGPGPDTVEMARYLAEENVQAIFFVTGAQVRNFPAAVPRLLELGHLVGNHTHNHVRLTDSSVTDVEACSEFVQAAALLGQLEVPQPSLFRPAYGAWNPHLAHLFNGHPGTCLSSTGPVNWDIDGGDYSFWRDQRSPQACVDSYLAAIEKRKRGIVLFHDFSADDPLTASRNRTFAMLRLLLPRLRDLGYSFATASDIPELQTAMRLGMHCALRAMNGMYAEVDSHDPFTLRATSRPLSGGARLFPAGPATVRLETNGGITLWPHLEVVSVSERRIGFRIPGGLSLACNPVTLRVEPESTPSPGAEIFQLVPLGAASPALLQTRGAAALSVEEKALTF